MKGKKLVKIEEDPDDPLGLNGLPGGVSPDTGRAPKARPPKHTDESIPHHTWRIIKRLVCTMLLRNRAQRAFPPAAPQTQPTHCIARNPTEGPVLSVDFPLDQSFSSFVRSPSPRALSDIASLAVLISLPFAFPARIDSIILDADATWPLPLGPLISLSSPAFAFTFLLPFSLHPHFHTSVFFLCPPSLGMSFDPYRPLFSAHFHSHPLSHIHLRPLSCLSPCSLLNVSPWLMNCVLSMFVQSKHLSFHLPPFVAPPYLNRFQRSCPCHVPSMYLAHHPFDVVGVLMCLPIFP